MGESSRLLAFSQSKQHLTGNVTLPLTFIYPGNRHNSTIDSECEQYYLMCTGDSGTLEPSVSPYYTYKRSNLAGGLNRIIISNITNIDSFKKAVDEYYGLVARWDLQANNGSIAYDTSGNSRNAKINGATWVNNGESLNLVEDIDYNIDRSSGILNISTNYQYNWVNVAWSYGFSYATRASNASEDVMTNLTGFIPWLGIILTVIGAGVVLFFITRSEKGI
jgi:hypothetical protein